MATGRPQTKERPWVPAPPVWVSLAGPRPHAGSVSTPVQSASEAEPPLVSCSDTPAGQAPAGAPFLNLTTPRGQGRGWGQPWVAQLASHMHGALVCAPSASPRGLPHSHFLFATPRTVSRSRPTPAVYQLENHVSSSRSASSPLLGATSTLAA